ncbi:hypothetical protein FRC08_002496 [Ceratobasidium sp. 394]|nr:hypothetical protein FRC08_002496 [Ceratobasidium sp. 394]KAG9098853.1 hypothetical protein FS749_002777 [Ceratobasidium sp. UAMH 11750]
MFQRPRSPMMQPPASAWNTTTSATIHAAMMPLPGFSELQRAASSLIDDVKVQGYNDEQCALLSKRIDRLLRVIRDFGGPQFLDLSELSREPYQIKERFEDENKRAPRFGISGAERRLSMLDNLREEISGLVEETQLRMLSRAVRANQAKDEADRLQMAAQSRELQAAKLELEHLRRAAQSHEEQIMEKNRALQILIDDAQAYQLEITQLEERINALRGDNAVLIQRWLDHMNERANQINSFVN